MGGGCPGVRGIGRERGHLLTVRVDVGQTLIKTEYWDRIGGEVGHACNSRKRKKVGACYIVCVRFYLHGSEMHNHWKFETLEFRVGLRSSGKALVAIWHVF